MYVFLRYKGLTTFVQDAQYLFKKDLKIVLFHPIQNYCDEPRWKESKPASLWMKKASSELKSVSVIE